MLTGRLKASGDIGPFRKAFAGSIAQGDRPAAAQSLGPLHSRENMSCVVILTPSLKTQTDREMEEIEATGEKAKESRQEERIGRHEAIEARYGERGDARS